MTPVVGQSLQYLPRFSGDDRRMLPQGDSVPVPGVRNRYADDVSMY